MLFPFRIPSHPTRAERCRMPLHWTFAVAQRWLSPRMQIRWEGCEWLAIVPPLADIGCLVESVWYRACEDT